MKTPCQEAPEAWTGGDIDLRAEAVTLCQTCPDLEACRARVENDPTLRFGVIAGIDYDGPKRRPGRPKQDDDRETKDCDHCGTTFERQPGRRDSQWATQRYCGNSCSISARFKAQREAAA